MSPDSEYMRANRTISSVVPVSDEELFTGIRVKIFPLPAHKTMLVRSKSLTCNAYSIFSVITLSTTTSNRVVPLNELSVYDFSRIN